MLEPPSLYDVFEYPPHLNPTAPPPNVIGSELLVHAQLTNPTLSPISVVDIQARGSGGQEYVYQPPQSADDRVGTHIVGGTFRFDPVAELPIRLQGGDGRNVWVKLFSDVAVGSNHLDLAIAFITSTKTAKASARARR